MRYYRLSFALLTAVLLFSACNGSPGVIIPDFGRFDGLSVEGQSIQAAHKFTNTELEAFSRLVNRYNKENEHGISVTLKRVEGRDDAEESDCALLAPPQASYLLRKNSSIELSPLVMHPVYGIEGGRKIFYKAAARQTDYWNFSRRITSIPLLINTEIILYNNDLLEAAEIDKFPGSWLTFNIALYKLSRRLETPALGIESNYRAFVNLINARGGSIRTPSGTSYSFINPVVTRTIRYLRRLKKHGLLSLNDTEYKNQSGFAFGNIPFVITGFDGIKYYSELINMTSPGMNWQTALIPTRRPGKGTSIDCSCAASIISGEKEKMLASWFFIKWLAEPEQQIELAKMTNSIPASMIAVEQIMDDSSGEIVEQWFNALQLVDASHMEYYPDFPDSDLVADMFETTANSCLDENLWIWYRTLKLEHEVRRSYQNR